MPATRALRERIEIKPKKRKSYSVTDQAGLSSVETSSLALQLTFIGITVLVPIERKPGFKKINNRHFTMMLCVGSNSSTPPTKVTTVLSPPPPHPTDLICSSV